MKKTITVRFDPELLAEIDNLARPKSSRSAFIEEILREQFKEKRSQSSSQGEIELSGSNVDCLDR